MHKKHDFILIQGAREHNLKNLTLKIPRNKLVVITGLSGSGKSSLAFDTLYAEGQRRYVESLSAYARQFLEQLQKPDVEHIEGISPAIAIEQRNAARNPRSTVATVTEIYDYLRLLFARIGKPHCAGCGREVTRQSSQEIVEKIMQVPSESRLMIIAPVIRGRKGEYIHVFKQARKDGFVRVRVNGVLHDLTEAIKLDKKRAHTIEIVIDRVVVKTTARERIADSVETALRIGGGLVGVVISDNHAPGTDRELLFSEQYACPHCDISIGEIEPRIFSFNSPYGACPSCSGLGTHLEIDPDMVIKDPSKSLREGAVELWRRGGKRIILYYRRIIREVAREHDICLDTPFKKLSKRHRQIILYGDGDYFEGVAPNLERRFRETESDFVKNEISKCMSVLPCQECHGARLKKESLAITIHGTSIHEITRFSVNDALEFFTNYDFTETEMVIAHQILKEITARLMFMKNVGLDYLTLDRQSSTLSGGEAQRIRLATQIGAGLVGVLYILDEPSIGLHPRDTAQLLATLKALQKLGNTLIVIEHDEATIRAADYIIDLGPGAGKHGGEVVAAGPLSVIEKSRKSLTGKYLRGDLKIPLPKERRSKRGVKKLTIRGASEHNLKSIDVCIPLGLMTCITGVSGSGKSTLVEDILYRALAQHLYRAKHKPGAFRELDGADELDKVIVIDQTPIGRTPRSNAVTYTGTFSYIRDLLSKTPEARARGYKPGRFSFNVKGGRCEACHGDGVKKIEMHFLPDVYVRCDICNGKRFNDQTLQVTYKGKSIADILSMTVEDGLAFFEHIPPIAHKLKTLNDVGLGYIELGQPATTLSGGEAQRVKLATELSKRATGRTLYILDEPTTGLHFADTAKLLQVLHTLVDAGNTAVIIEHNLDVIKTADHIIDLGPEGGDRGGRIVVEGTPEEVSAHAASSTGHYLKAVL